jgi:hypothetical protein
MPKEKNQLILLAREMADVIALMDNAWISSSTPVAGCSLLAVL